VPVADRRRRGAGPVVKDYRPADCRVICGRRPAGYRVADSVSSLIERSAQVGGCVASNCGVDERRRRPAVVGQSRAPLGPVADEKGVEKEGGAAHVVIDSAALGLAAVFYKSDVYEGRGGVHIVVHGAAPRPG